jgi:hypothetical protein
MHQFDIHYPKIYYLSMKSLYLYAAALCMLSLIMGCATPNDTTDSADPVDVDTGLVDTTDADPDATSSTDVAFDPNSVTSEQKQETLEDIREVIARLNRIISERDFETWKSYCTEEYIDHWSSTEELQRYSDAPVLKRAGIVLKSLYDFFIYVVYPSRQNVKVDDIEFLSYNRVRVYMIGARGERLIVYDLEKIDGTWKIAYWGEYK